MTIDRFREVLGAVGPPPDARELSELLWLACHISGPEETAPPAPVRPQRPVSAPPGPPGFTTPRPDGPVPVPPVPLTALHPPPGPAPEPAGGAAAEVLVPTAPMLADPLGVQRALRPLKRRVPSRHRTEVDEEATAARIADTRRWTPVLVPSPERWLSLTLVVDTGPTMRLWRPLARELAEALLRQGAFQDLHVSYLGATGRVTSAPGAPSQDPATLLDASGRHAVLVLSDCSGPHWWDGRAAQAVRRWARAGPTAILQPLPEHLWRRTAAPASPGLALLPRPGAPNTDLRFSPYDGAATPGVHVPVLEVAPRWFGAWARLLSGSDPQPAAIATLPARPPGTAPPARERELPVAERVRRFLATASPDAAELAAHVAVSVPSLPVMRLIQHRILGRSGPGQLAEVLLSGLLRPAGGVRYEFVPGAREALLDTLPRPEAQHTRHVLKAVSAEIERRAGTSAETFRALLPAEGGPLTLTTDTAHFALVTPETRTHLTRPAQAPSAMPSLLDIQDATVDELIGENWDRPPGRVPIGVDHGQAIVQVDVLNDSEYGPHGLITGPAPLRHALLRTLLFGLALRHSPNVVSFTFADISGGAPLAGLENLPHVVNDLHAGSADSLLISRLRGLLEAERERRKAVLRNSGTARWDDYRADAAEGDSLEPLPAMLVVIDDAGALLAAQPTLLESIVALNADGSALGIRFVFCTPDDVGLPPVLGAYVSWQMGTPGAAGPGSAFLHVPGEVSVPSFRPASISPDAADPIVERMKERARRVRGFPWPDDAAPPPAPAQPAAAELAPAEPVAAEPSPIGTAAPPPAVPRFDVLKLNGGGTSGMFEETWARSALEARDPAIGYDLDGNVVTLYPLDISAGTPHGLIVGEPEARQHALRDIALALAASYAPGDLTFAFAGLGEHPLGERLSLPHTVFSEEELLGRPQRLQNFIDYITAELEARVHGALGDAPGLVVFADLSLTLPGGRKQVAGALQSIAQRGRTGGMQLLVGASTVEDTPAWNRLLPLLGWRLAVSPLPPDVSQRVMGRARLPFPRVDTAHLRAGNDGPREFTLAPEPPGPAIAEFAGRAFRQRRVLAEQAARPSLDAELIDVLIEGLHDSVPHVEANQDGDYEVIDTVQVRAALREILLGQVGETRAGRPPRLRHLILPAPYALEMTTVARLYGEILGERGLLAQGNLITLSHGRSHWDQHRDASIARIYRAAQGSVVLVHDAPGILPEDTYLRPEMIRNLITALTEEPEDALVVLCGDADRFRELLGAVPGFGERFQWVTALEAGTRSEPDEDPAVTEILRQLRRSETQAGPDERRSRHIVYAGTDTLRIARLAAEYGGMLAERGALAHGNVRIAHADWLGYLVREPGRTMADVFRESRGGVLLLQMSREQADPGDASSEGIFPEQLRSLVEEYGEDPVVIVCADDGQMIGLRRFDPHFATRYRRLLEFPGIKDADSRPDEPPGPPPDLPELVYAGELPAVTDRRIPIGVADGTREPVYVDFDADPHLLVAGPPGSGRANALQLLIDGIWARQGRPKAEIHVFDAHEILLSLAEEFGLTEAAGPGVGYTDSAEEFRETVAGLVRRPPDAEVFLFVIDRDLEDDPLRNFPHDVLASKGNLIHLVLARLLTVLDQPVDPLVSTLHEMGAPALLLGSRFGEENRLYEAEPPSGSGVAGRGVLVRGGRRHVLQVAHASPFA